MFFWRLFLFLNYISFRDSYHPINANADANGDTSSRRLVASNAPQELLPVCMAGNGKTSRAC